MTNLSFLDTVFNFLNCAKSENAPLAFFRQFVAFMMAPKMGSEIDGRLNYDRKHGI